MGESGTTSSNTSAPVVQRCTCHVCTCHGLRCRAFVLHYRSTVRTSSRPRQKLSGRAFHHYSIGNQLAALFQCWLRQIPVGPIFSSHCGGHQSPNSVAWFFLSQY